MADKHIIIEVPEKIEFRYRIADLGPRVGAYCLDLLIQAVILFLYILILVFTGYFSADLFDQESFIADIAAFGFLLVFFLQWGYSLFWETLFNGQTPGKKAMKIRVIKRNGEALDFSTLVLRNLLRAVDSLPVPFLMLLGGLVASFDKKTRRVGDIVAGTLVIKISNPSLIPPSFNSPIGMGPAAELPTSKRLTERDLYIIRNFFNKCGLLSIPKEKELAQKLCSRVCEKLQCPLPSEGGEKDTLKQIYRAHTINENP